MKSPFAFRQHGQCGQWVSSLLPNLAECVDDLTLFQAMVAKSSNHTPAAFQMNSGFTMNGFPCMGAWVSYGLGTVNQDLPAFVVLPDPRGMPAGGAINWTAGFLPAENQGVAFRTSGDPIPDLFPAKDDAPAAPGRRRSARQDGPRFRGRRPRRQRPGRPRSLLRTGRADAGQHPRVAEPRQGNRGDEEAVRPGLGGHGGFWRNCLLARRLLERGVRFVQLIHGGAFGSPRINWDAHEDIVDNHTKQAAILDKPVAGLLKDLKARGLLDDTLVLWTTEFGRTPFTQGVGAKGRDHHPLVFTCWMAGAGLKKGFRHGSSDEVGYQPAEDATSIYDFHATILHLLGIDHKRLTFYHNGIRRRLTDVHGEVIDKVLA